MSSRTDNVSNLQQLPPLPSDPPGLQATSINAQDDGLFLPPIHTSPSIITIQPSSIREENRSSRRSVPINTLDWVSTPRSQLGVFSRTYFLSSIEQLEIQQVVDLSSLLGKSKNGAQYRVRVPRAETIFLAIEDSKECQRTFLRSSRELTLNVMDPSGETSFVIRKSLGWGCMPGFLHRVSVESTDYVGSVEQNFTVLGISFTVYDHNRTPLCFIDGPNVYSCCMSTQTQFQIVSVDKSRQIASLIRHWDHALVDYSVLLTFTPDTDVKLKGLLLGAAFLLEFLYFERRGGR